MKFPFPPGDPFQNGMGLSLYPPTTDNSLRPWDGADEYLLSTILDEYGADPSLKVVAANDSHGALTVPLAPSMALSLTDSYSARASITENLKDAGRTDTIRFAGYMDDFEGDMDLIAMKIPKSLNLFRFQLARLAEKINKPVPILAAGMAKLMPQSFYQAFETAAENPEYSLIRKRARYYRGILKPREKQTLENHQFLWEDKPFVSLPGVFSYGKPDRGTLFLLDRFPRVDPPEVVVDPGCGCGILGIQAALTWPEARVIGTDDSALAVESSRLSAQINGVDGRMEFRQTNILDGVEDRSADLVICNPPFHSQHRIQLERGFSFIDESARVLKTGGRLFLVSNRYLGYEKHLKSAFQSMKILGQDSKFRLYMCRR